MKFAFVLDDIILWHEPLGVMTVAAMLLREGHEVEYFALGAPDEYPQTIERLKAWGPAMIGFSASTGIHRRYADFCRLARAALPDVFIVAGGPHGTFFPDFLEDNREHIDALCVGEGEHAVVELAAALEAGEDTSDIRNLHVVLPDGSIKRNPTRPFLQDLDALPFPDRSFAGRFPHLEQSGIGYIMAGRGCPYRCAFCFNHVAQKVAEGQYVRWRSPERVCEELVEMRDRWRRRLVSFQDDTLTLNKEWFLEFARHYEEKVRLPYVCHVRADRVDDDIAEALRSSGCVRAVMGLESGSDYLRNEIMGKRVTTRQILDASRRLTERGIELLTQNMFGVPGETPATALETIYLNIRCGASVLILYFFQPYPGTRLAERAREMGLWQGEVDDIDDSYHWRLALDLKHGRVIERIADLSHLFVDRPWLFRVVAPAMRAATAIGAPGLMTPLLKALSWHDRRTANTPQRGAGSRYHDPPEG